MRDQFVSKLFRQLDQGYLHTANNLLVVAGGRAERELFRSLSLPTSQSLTDSAEAAEHLEPFQGLRRRAILELFAQVLRVGNRR